MSRMRVILNRQGVRELLESQEMESIITEHAESIRARCGDGFETHTFKGTDRVKASVSAETVHAARKNAKYNIILKAVK